MLKRHFVILLLLLPLAALADDEQFLDTTAWSVQTAVTKKQAWRRSDIATVPKFGGYIIGSYKYDSGSPTHGDGFNLRLVRAYVDGTIMRDFAYRLQVELNNTVHIVDAYVEWQRWKFLRVKAGEFKRAFTFENPYNPWDVGVGDYSSVVKKLAGMGDRCGEPSTGGRDLGFQLQGDLFRSPRDGHYQLHYQAAVYNGQGINQKEANGKKDWIGTLQWSPLRDLYIGAFGWKGSYTAQGITVRRDRYAFGLKYEGQTGWSARAEYARSRGYKISDYDAEKHQFVGSKHADAWYATLGAPVYRWLKLYLRYDAYRDYAASTLSTYSLAANLRPHKNLQLQLQYNLVHDHQTTHQAWAQMYVRF